MPEADKHTVRRTTSSRDSRTSRSSKHGRITTDGHSVSPDRTHSHGSQSHSKEPSEKTPRHRKESVRSNSPSKLRRKSQIDSDGIPNGTSKPKKSSSKKDKGEQSPTRERKAHRERSRSREGDKSRSRSRSVEKSSRRDGSSSPGKSKRRESTTCRSIDRSDRSDAGSVSGTNDRAERSRSRDRSKSKERSSSRDRSKSKERSRSKDRSSSRERSKSRDRGSSGERRPSTANDADDASVRRRKMSDSERSKRPSYLKSIAANKKDKEISEGRKSSVLGSLHAFLEEGRASAPSPREAGDRSVVSSATKIQRRKRSSMPSGSASVYGGQVVGSRDEVRNRRRSRSSSMTPENDAVSVSEPNRELRRSLNVRSRTPSARTRQSTLAHERHSFSGEASMNSSFQTSMQPSDHPPLLRENSARSAKKLSLSTGAEVPPGFPVAAVDKTVGSGVNEMELAGHSSGPIVLESTAQIKERQQRRALLGERTSSSKSLGANDTRTLRRKKSLQALAPTPPPPRSTTMTQVENQNGGQEVDHNTSSSSRLGRVDARTSPGRPSRRKSSSGQSINGATSTSDRYGKCSTPRKPLKRTVKVTPIGRSGSDGGDEEDSGLASFLGMPKTDDDDDDNSNRKHGLERSGDSDDVSVASLDPSILKNSSQSGIQINSLQELYQQDKNNDEQHEGYEGELELKDDSTQATQENSIESYKNQILTPLSKESIVMFDSVQLQQGRDIGPGSLSPHSSSLSGTSDSLRSPGVLKRKSGQPKAESPNTNRRVSWVELPMTNPGTLLVKSTDTDGTNERATETSPDLVASIHDLYDEAGLARAAMLASEAQEGQKNGKTRKNPSLDAAIRQDKDKQKRHPTDERTVGTAATNTSEATMKTNNKSEDTLAARKLLASKIDERERRLNSTDSDRPGVSRTTSSSSLSRSSRSSVRRSKDSTSDGSSSTLSRKSKSSKDDDVSENKVKKTGSKVSSKTKTSSKSDGKRKDDGESTKGRQRRSTSMDRSVIDSPSTQREPLRRTKSDSKNAHLKACSKVKYISKQERAENQVTGEPTTESSRDKDVASVTRSLDTPLTKKKKSYLTRRNLMKENKEKSQGAKSSVMSSLDNFLAKMEEDDSSLVVDDHRSVYSDNGLKGRKIGLRSRRRESDDRSVTSAPSLIRARRASESLKVKAAAKKVSTWWNLNRDDGD